MALCHPSGFTSHGWGHLGVSGISAWPWALGALPGCLSQLDLGTLPGDAEGRKGGWDVPGGLELLFSCEDRVLWGGICSCPAPKKAQLEAALGGCFPLSVPNLLGLFLLGLDLKRVVN